MLVYIKIQRFATIEAIKIFATWTSLVVPVIKNLPTNAGDMGPIPGTGRSSIPQDNEAHAPQVLKPTCPRAHALQQEKPPQ